MAKGETGMKSSANGTNNKDGGTAALIDPKAAALSTLGVKNKRLMLWLH